MTDNAHEIERNDDKLITTDVSDEALESLGTIANAAFTLGACTGLSVCPA